MHKRMPKLYEKYLEKRVMEKTSNKDDKCPYCGETKSYIEYLKNGISDKGLKVSIYCGKWFWCAKWNCQTCGAEWNSEPYRL